jgi:hypothetical protein
VFNKSPDSLTLADFRSFFAAIPEDRWTTGEFYNSITGACCARGHLGELPGVSAETYGSAHNRTLRLRALCRQNGGDFPLSCVNDGTDSGKVFDAPDPRGRVLQLIDAALEVEAARK